MTAEQAIEQGDFQGALAALAQETAGPSADPSRLLMRFSMEVRLQQFAAASQTMQRIVAAAPDLAGPMGAFAAAAQAEQLATARARDPGLAGQRAGVGMPPPYALALVKAAVCHAHGDAASALAAIKEAGAATPPIPGTLTRVNGHAQRFTALCDSDALTGATLPVYDGGKVLDLALSELASITFAEPKTSFDVMWRPAEIITVEGVGLRVRVPAFYCGTGLAADGAVRTGQMTVWDHSRGYAQALGQRDWHVTTAEGGQTVVGILGVARIDFDNPRRARQAGGPGQGASPAGQSSPLSAGVRSIADLTFYALAARAAVPALFRLMGMAGIHFGGRALYEGLRGLLSLVAVILYFIWFSRMYAWVRNTRGGTAYSTGFAIGAWFIPFVNFVVPYKALKDASDRTLGAPSPLVSLWWAGYLSATFLTLFFSMLEGGAVRIDLGGPAVLNGLSWLLTLSQIVGYGTWAKIVKDLSART